MDQNSGDLNSCLQQPGNLTTATKKNPGVKALKKQTGLNLATQPRLN